MLEFIVTALKMLAIHQLLIIFAVAAVSCTAHDCKTESKWVKAREDCQKAYAKDDPCIWNCVQEALGGLDDSGHLSKEKVSNVLKQMVKNPELREPMLKTALRCLSQSDSETDKCTGSKQFVKCIWEDKDYVQAMKAVDHCVSDPELS